jgi:hypothetical protein
LMLFFFQRHPASSDLVEAAHIFCTREILVFCRDHDVINQLRVCIQDEDWQSICV